MSELRRKAAVRYFPLANVLTFSAFSLLFAFSPNILISGDVSPGMFPNNVPLF